jgi:hypothetical protein
VVNLNKHVEAMKLHLEDAKITLERAAKKVRAGQE